MKMTLLDLVQSILLDLNSDEVDSIGDTVESLQVANILKNTYFSMMATRNWPHLRQSIQLTGMGSTGKPTHMRLPEGTKELCFVNYNKQAEDETRLRYEEITYIDPDAFLRRCNKLNSDNEDVAVVEDYSGVQLLIQTDRSPQYYTTFDDNYIIFDSYNTEDDDTLIASKVQAMAYVTPSWSMTDSAYPDIPAEAYPLLLNEAMSVASYRLNQSADQKAEQEATRQDKWLSQKSRRIANHIRYPDYGRGSAK